MEINKKIYGDSHIVLAETLNNLGAIEKDLNKPENAENFFK